MKQVPSTVSSSCRWWCLEGINSMGGRTNNLVDQKAFIGAQTSVMIVLEI